MLLTICVIATCAVLHTPVLRWKPRFDYFPVNLYLRDVRGGAPLALRVDSEMPATCSLMGSLLATHSTTSGDLRRTIPLSEIRGKTCPPLYLEETATTNDKLPS